MSSSASELPAGLSAPAVRALTAAGHTSLDSFQGAAPKDLLALHGVGPKAIRIISAALHEHGLRPLEDRG